MRVLLLVALVVLAGCGPATRNVRLSPTTRDPAPEAVPIQLFSATVPRCPFEDIGIISSQGRDFTTGSAVLEGLRREARRLGGDAVVQVRFVGEGILSGTVIRFTTPDCRQ